MTRTKGAGYKGYRIFDGKRYQIVASTLSSKEAQKVAKYYRTFGQNVRVVRGIVSGYTKLGTKPGRIVHYGKGYRIYARKK